MEMGEAFGGRDRRTVIYACKVVTERIGDKLGLKESIARIESWLRR